MAETLPPVGDRIRSERARRGLSVRGLAREVGVSPSLISQIETGRSRPSVSTLYSITRALGISVEDVFDTSVAQAAGASSGLHGPLAAVAQAMANAPTGSTLAGPDLTARRPLGPHVSPDQREILELDSGVTWELLGRVPGAHVDFLLVTYAPGGTSSSTGQLMRHSGVEYGYLSSGELVLTLGFEDHVMRPGDGVSFASTTPHRYRNDGTEPAVGVWCVIETE